VITIYDLAALVWVSLFLAGIQVYLHRVLFLSPSLATWTSFLLRKKGEEKLFTRKDWMEWARDQAPFLRSLLSCDYCPIPYLAVIASLPLWFLFPWAVVFLSLPVSYLLVDFYVTRRESNTGGIAAKETLPPGETEKPLHKNETDPSIHSRLGVTFQVMPDSTIRTLQIDPLRKKVMEVFEEGYLTDNPRLSNILGEYNQAVRETKESNPSCSECELNALKDKFYERIRTVLVAEHKDAPGHSQVP
jgi:hypothetical protein